MSPSNPEEAPDCTDRCKSSQHGDIITAAISRRSVTDYDLCCFLHYICTCCESVRDSAGRTALHVAASCGRVDLVRWLVQSRHANVNAKDDESGYTALHRSIFYGKINVAVELIKLGANTALLDSNSLTMLEHAMKDGFAPEDATCGELYVWGSNTNNSLGPQQARTAPELLDVFHKKYPDETIVQFCVEKFHSVILGSSGKAYSCGHGHGGRLGLGTQQTVVIPETINFPENSHSEPISCIDTAISRDHSVFLCSDGIVYTCGSNAHRVLGINSVPQQVLIPTQVKRFSAEIKGVCAGVCHSVVWGPQALYTWGLNAGQLGHKMGTDDKYITGPKAVKMLNIADTHIMAVSSSDGAISVYTKKGDIYVLHEYQCRKIASRLLNVVQVNIFGGKLNSSLSKELSCEPNRELKVVALTNTGNLLLWQESDAQLCRCIFSINRALVVNQLSMNADGILFVTRDGEAYQGFIRPRKKKTAAVVSGEKSAFHKFLDREDCISVKITKFPRIHRAICIKSDVKGNDYCVLQAPPYKHFGGPNVMESEIKERFTTLLQECNEIDGIHDVVFKVDSAYFPAHRYILASRSSYFEKLLIDNDKVVELKGYNPLIFEQFLSYIYTGHCDLMSCGECPPKLRILCEKSKDASNKDDGAEALGCVEDGNSTSAFEVYSKSKRSKRQGEENKENSSKIKNPVRMLHEMAKKFGCVDLCNVLSNFDMQKFTIRNKTSKRIVATSIQFDRTGMLDFYDVTIKCLDGKEVSAHKCVLAAQSDYFNNMFSMRWHGTEKSTVTLPWSRGIVEGLLEFLYTDTLSYLNNKEQDHLFKLLMLADQLFITRLKEQCELLLFHCLNLKNAVQFLSFADMYNALKLKKCCMRFIAYNMAPLLELQGLDELDEDVLKELSDFYFQERQELACRVITPYSTAPLEEEILSIRSAFPVCLEKEFGKSTGSKSSSQKRRLKSHRSINSLENGQKPVTSVKVSSGANNSHDDTLVQFPDSSEEVPSIENAVINRLRAIRLAREAVADEDCQPQFTQLRVRSKNDSESQSELLATSFEEFPLLNSPPNSVLQSRQTHKFEGGSRARHKPVKMSQKQRKRLSLESTAEVAPPESPKNPWKIVNIAGSCSPVETKIDQIISSEKKQRENLSKIKSKMLIYTQMEDKAIVELLKFYNAENATDEIIIVERVNVGAIATPVWVPGVKRLE